MKEAYDCESSTVDAIGSIDMKDRARLSLNGAEEHRCREPDEEGVLDWSRTHDECVEEENRTDKRFGESFRGR